MRVPLQILCCILLSACGSYHTSPDLELLRAADAGQTSALIRACRAGAHLNVRSDDGQTALGLALERINRGEGVCGAADDTISPVWENVELLLKAGANPNIPHRHTTPLHLAAGSGNPELVRLLLHYGARPDAETRSCLAPLWEAVYTDNPAVAEVLLQAGANPHIPNTEGQTPLEFLRMQGRTHSRLYHLLRTHETCPNHRG